MTSDLERLRSASSAYRAQLSSEQWSDAEGVLAARLSPKARERVLNALDLYVDASYYRRRDQIYAKEKGRLKPNGEVHTSTLLLRFRRALRDVFIAREEVERDPVARAAFRDYETAHPNPGYPNFSETLGILSFHAIGLKIFLSDNLQKSDPFISFVGHIENIYEGAKGARPPRSSVNGDVFPAFIQFLHNTLPPDCVERPSWSPDGHAVDAEDTLDKWRVRVSRALTALDRREADTEVGGSPN